MRKNLYLLLVLLPLVSCIKDHYIEISGYAQGGTYSVKLNTAGVSLPSEALKEGIDSIILRIDNSLSGYNKSSLLSRYNAGKEMQPDDLLLEMYAYGRRFYEETGGALDVASAPLFDIWGFGFKSGELPSDEKVDSVRRSCGMARMGVDMMASRPASLNFNAIAQGYSCDLVADFLKSAGVKDMLINIGGEMYCSGKSPSGNFWKIGIDRPEDGNVIPGAHLQEVFSVSNVPCGVVTSGNYRKFYIRDGHKYSHTVDPRTGYPVEHSLLCATIIAPDAVSADAYATYCMVVGLEEAKEFIISREDIEGCLIYDEEGQMKSWASDGFAIEH